MHGKKRTIALVIAGLAALGGGCDDPKGQQSITPTELAAEARTGLEDCHRQAKRAAPVPSVAQNGVDHASGERLHLRLGETDLYVPQDWIASGIIYALHCENGSRFRGKDTKTLLLAGDVCPLQRIDFVPRATDSASFLPRELWLEPGSQIAQGVRETSEESLARVRKQGFGPDEDGYFVETPGGDFVYKDLRDGGIFRVWILSSRGKLGRVSRRFNQVAVTYQFDACATGKANWLDVDDAVTRFLAMLADPDG